MSDQTKTEKQFTPATVAGMLGTTKKTVLKLIDVQELRAVDIGTTETPRWRISETDLRQFVEHRANMARTVMG